VANVCGLCVPKPNACLNKDCGTVFDGCKQVSCGAACTGGKTCGGGGVANLCGVCTPTTSCGAQNRICGTLSNGCMSETCGACASGERCTNNGTECCKPQTCSAHVGQCGTFSDGCGQTISCGCAGGYTCVGNSCCQPKTCFDFGLDGRDCVAGPQRIFSDTCGGLITCDVCEMIGI
jgi:hypothetical protein